MSLATRLPTLLLVIAAFLIVPFANAQGDGGIDNPDESTPTTLYFHIFDTVNRFVINTQAMDAEFFEVGGANFPSTPGTGVPAPGTGAPTEDGWDFNTIYGYSTAGPVEYEFIENGRPRFHPERGIAATVEIDSSVQPVVYMYLDPRDASGVNNAPTVSPQMTLRLLMQEGDDPGRDADLDAGKDIMVGMTRFHMAKGGASGGNPAGCGQNAPDGYPILCPDESGYVEVVVPMEVMQDFIPKSEAYNIRVDWYQSGEQVGEDEATTGWLRLAADKDHLPRMELNIFNPVYFSFIHPQVAAGTLLIHAGGNSPWGTYDVDLDKVAIDMRHESGTAVPQNQLLKILNSNEHVHGLHDEDTQMTYLWDFRDNGAELGIYTIDMTVTNDANTQEAYAKAHFEVRQTEAIGFDTEGNEVESTVTEDFVEEPTVGAVAVIGLLAAALVLVRRRIE